MKLICIPAYDAYDDYAVSTARPDDYYLQMNFNLRIDEVQLSFQALMAHLYLERQQQHLQSYEQIGFQVVKTIALLHRAQFELQVRVLGVNSCVLEVQFCKNLASFLIEHIDDVPTNVIRFEWVL
ncbi:MAG: hypothetical protein EZS28_055442 [Streblomastix strix]|uniref:Uncharacterized protein n=1 Tax=Streblomastix strix TaxID=222440 RepID=A0A5J4Q2M3_9EUKA|nr:MAG: hypothetical protein EZS28_055442 [Streblomastix strix]